MPRAPAELPADVPADAIALRAPPNAVATLVTASDTGRKDLTFADSWDAARRPLVVQHSARAGSETRLRYRGVDFAGPFLLDAKGGYSANLIQSDTPTGRNRWAGDRDGADHMEVRSAGRVGLYL
jgi:hypothetical protein